MPLTSIVPFCNIKHKLLELGRCFTHTQTHTQSKLNLICMRETTTIICDYFFFHRRFSFVLLCFAQNVCRAFTPYIITYCVLIIFFVPRRENFLLSHDKQRMNSILDWFLLNQWVFKCYWCACAR